MMIGRRCGDGVEVADARCSWYTEQLIIIKQSLQQQQQQQRTL